MFSYRPPHMAEQKQGDQLEHTYSEDTGCSPEDLPKAMNDRVEWRERIRDIRAGDTTRWWWWPHLIWALLVCSLIKICHYFFSILLLLSIIVFSFRIKKKLNYGRWEKKLMESTEECWVLSWTTLGSSTPQNSNCTATCLKQCI